MRPLQHSWFKRIWCVRWILVLGKFPDINCRILLKNAFHSRKGREVFNTIYHLNNILVSIFQVGKDLSHQVDNSVFYRNTGRSQLLARHKGKPWQYWWFSRHLRTSFCLNQCRFQNEPFLQCSLWNCKRQRRKSSQSRKRLRGKPTHAYIDSYPLLK
jgi:hypothetical protein